MCSSDLVLGDSGYIDRMNVITDVLTKQIYDIPYDGRSMPAECENGDVKEDRIWWVQAESVNGFVNAWQKDKSREDYKQAALNVWKFIEDFVIDKREGSEWYWEVDKDGRPKEGDPIVEPWKCPYHNGRMCLELIRRGIVF